MFLKQKFRASWLRQRQVIGLILLGLGCGLLLLSLMAGRTAARPLVCTDECVYLPLTVYEEETGVLPTPTPTPTPTLPPPSFDNCEEDPDPNTAVNFPVRIVSVDKAAEVATLENVSTAAVDLTGWRLCSIEGNQEHEGINGILSPGEEKDFPRMGGPIWNNSTQTMVRSTMPTVSSLVIGSMNRTPAGGCTPKVKMLSLSAMHTWYTHFYFYLANHLGRP